MDSILYVCVFGVNLLDFYNLHREFHQLVAVDVHSYEAGVMP